MTTTEAKSIPGKLKHDFLVEALLEIRFESPTTVGEVLFGRLADYEPWKGFKQDRLPISEMPAVIRNGDPDFRFTPWYSLTDPEHNRSVRIGQRVLSYHQLAPYVGWKAFKPELMKTIDGLFAKAPDAKVQRLGLRYINGARADVHQITSVSDLDIRIRIADEVAPPGINLNFTSELSGDAECTVRIASRPFVKGPLSPETTIIIDVDVFTKSDTSFIDPGEVKAWVERAHTAEKEQFFRVLKSETIDALTEK